MPEVPRDFYRAAFSRNLGLLSEDEQRVLRRSCVGVAGAGGVGALHLLALTRMGVGKFHLADFDTFEYTNFNRQFGAMVDTIGRKKIDVMKEMVQAINPEAEVVLFPEGVQPDNVASFLSGTQAVVDGIDFFAFDHRRMLFNEARRAGLHVLTSGPVGWGATLQVFSPTGMSFDEYFGMRDGMTEFEKFVAFAVGIAPAVLHRKYMDMSKIKVSAAQAPVVAAGCLLSSAIIATETINVLLQRRPVKAVPHYFQFDMYLQVYKKRYLAFGARNPLQAVKRAILRRTMKHLAGGQKLPGQ